MKKWEIGDSHPAQVTSRFPHYIVSITQLQHTPGTLFSTAYYSPCLTYNYLTKVSFPDEETTIFLGCIKLAKD